MPGRMSGPGAYQWLDWGPRDGTGGSRVHDADGNGLRPHDRVQRIAPGVPRSDTATGTVIELLDAATVTVMWAGTRRPRPVPSAELHLVRAATDDEVAAAQAATLTTLERIDP